MCGYSGIGRFALQRGSGGMTCFDGGDYFGRPRDESNPAPGPFERYKDGEPIKVFAK